MSEYWKSTPKYWCKHCSVFVRDTKLERTNHEATGKHQGAVKRALRDLHRGADQKEREKERAKREVDRLNGVVSGSSSSSATGGPSRTRVAYDATAAAPQASQADRQKQLEQLAELGVNIPTELRSGMAMAGEWTVTSTRVVEQDAGDKANSKEDPSADGRATGVKRERERTEDEKESEEAIKGLFKKPRKWGIDSKTMPAAEDAELEALLNGPLVKAKKEETEQPRVKEEEDQQDVPAEVSEPVKEEQLPLIKKEADEEASQSLDLATKALPEAPSEATEAEVPVVAFKKRKPKNIRQK